MQRKAWLDKVTKTLRNYNIARLYFDEGKTSNEIQKDYPELTRQRIFKIAYLNKDKYDK